MGQHTHCHGIASPSSVGLVSFPTSRSVGLVAGMVSSLTSWDGLSCWSIACRSRSTCRALKQPGRTSASRSSASARYAELASKALGPDPRGFGRQEAFRQA